jgi:hypothetical protein
MGNYDRFGRWSGLSNETGVRRISDEFDFDGWLGVVYRVLREFPEARRAIDAALAEWLSGADGGESGGVCM